MTSENEPSDIGLNTWALGEFDWQERTDPYDLLRSAVRNDITYLDCSPLYSQGQSEEWVGTLLDELDVRSECFVASKFGLRSSEKGTFRSIEEYDNLRQQVEKSLSRLRLDRLDLAYLYQSPSVSLSHQEEWVSRLKEENLTDQVGFVVLEPEDLNGRVPDQFHYLQKPGSLLDKFENTISAPSGCRSVGYDPLFGGLFDQRYAEIDSEVLDYEVRRHHPKFTANRVEYLSTLKEVQHDYRENHCPDRLLESRTLSWLLNHGPDQYLVLGMRNAEDVHRAHQAQSIADAGEDEEFIESIRTVWEKQGVPKFVAPPPLLPRHSFERCILSEQTQW